MRVTVQVTRRPEISDPHGTTITRALRELGYEQVRQVRSDRLFHLDVDGTDVDEVRRAVTEMCEKLLTNPVLEDYTIEVEP